MRIRVEYTLRKDLVSLDGSDIQFMERPMTDEERMAKDYDHFKFLFTTDRIGDEGILKRMRVDNPWLDSFMRKQGYVTKDAEEKFIDRVLGSALESAIERDEGAEKIKKLKDGKEKARKTKIYEHRTKVILLCFASSGPGEITLEGEGLGGHALSDIIDYRSLATYFSTGRSTS